MKLEGKMAELLKKLNPNIYWKYVTNKKRRTVLYVELKKSLYGTLQAALLFWRNLTSSLQEWVFEINPHEWCLENKTVDGTQMTFVWHVDNLNISHENGDTVDALINKISERYEKEEDLTIHRGKVHKYLGMKLDYRKEGKVKIDMTDYLKKILDDRSDKYQGRAITPAANHLFEVNKTTRKLNEKDAQAFHTIVEK